MEKGRILKQKKGLYTLETVDGTQKSGYAGSKLRKNGVKLLAGDIAEYVLNDDDTIFIVDIEERKNAFIRPPISNVDLLVLVVAAAEPTPDYYNIDCVLAVADAAGVKPLIVINKTDLDDASETVELYKSCGYDAFNMSALSEKIDPEFYESLKGVCVFTGQSGVGKSSLLNKYFPNLDLETGELSEKISRGKNTTRHTELFNAGNGLYVADTPGFGMLDFINFDLLSQEDFEAFSFPEFTDYKIKCKYRGCTHLKEEGCALIAAVKEEKVKPSRYESYKKLKNDLLQKESMKYK